MLTLRPVEVHSGCKVENESEQDKTRSREMRSEVSVGTQPGDNGGWKHGGGERRKSRQTGQTCTRSNHQDLGINRMERAGGQIPKAPKI